MMNRNNWRVIIVWICGVAVLASCATTGKYKPVDHLTTLDVAFADPIWTGRSIPEGQQCQRFDGQGATPRLHVKNIPAGTNALILEYSDRDSPTMNHGGHGIMGYRIAENASEVIVPSVPGHTFHLPENFFLISAQARPDWDEAGAYMPPCSGGKGNWYEVTIKAVYDGKETHATSKLLGQANLGLGTY